MVFLPLVIHFVTSHTIAPISDPLNLVKLSPSSSKSKFKRNPESLDVPTSKKLKSSKPILSEIPSPVDLSIQFKSKNTTSSSSASPSSSTSSSSTIPLTIQPDSLPANFEPTALMEVPARSLAKLPSFKKTAKVKKNLFGFHRNDSAPLGMTSSEVEISSSEFPSDSIPLPGGPQSTLSPPPLILSPLPPPPPPITCSPDLEQFDELTSIPSSTISSTPKTTLTPLQILNSTNSTKSLSSSLPSRSMNLMTSMTSNRPVGIDPIASILAEAARQDRERKESELEAQTPQYLILEKEFQSRRIEEAHQLKKREIEIFESEKQDEEQSWKVAMEKGRKKIRWKDRWGGDLLEIREFSSDDGLDTPSNTVRVVQLIILCNRSKAARNKVSLLREP